MKKSVFLILFAVFCTMFSFVGPVNAQQESGLGPDMDVTIVPENPKPNEVVFVSVVSYNTNINAAVISWSINGKLQKTGIGEKTFQFTVGGLGAETILEVTAKTADGQTIQRTLGITPTEVELIWQSEGSVPPFYKGKTLFAHQNKITFVATPHIVGSGGKEISPKNLIYEWKRNGTVMDDDSGYGKNTYTTTGSLISRSLTVDVSVREVGGDRTGHARISASPTEPSVLLYSKKPLYGIEFQKALSGSVSLTNSKEILLVGVPLFFGINKKASPDVSYTWSINGVKIDTDTTQTERVFRQKEGTKGTSNISLSIENSNKILQYATSKFNLSFDK